MKHILAVVAFLALSFSALRADDSAKLAAVLGPAADHGGMITIPSGDYEQGGTVLLPIASRMTVWPEDYIDAERARLPRSISAMTSCAGRCG